MSRILSTIAISLGITLAAELLTAWLMRVRKRSDIVLVILVNIITNPVVMYCFIVGGIFLKKRMLWGIIVGMELGACAAEAVLYRKYLKSEISPWKLSVLTNTVSFTAGLVIKYAVL